MQHDAHVKTKEVYDYVVVSLARRINDRLAQEFIALLGLTEADQARAAAPAARAGTTYECFT